MASDRSVANNTRTMEEEEQQRRQYLEELQQEFKRKGQTLCMDRLGTAKTVPDRATVTREEVLGVSDYYSPEMVTSQQQQQEQKHHHRVNPYHRESKGTTISDGPSSSSERIKRAIRPQVTRTSATSSQIVFPDSPPQPTRVPTTAEQDTRTVPQPVPVTTPVSTVPVPNMTQRMIGFMNSVVPRYIKPELTEMVTMNGKLQNQSLVVRVPIMAFTFVISPFLFFILYLLCYIDVQEGTRTQAEKVQEEIRDMQHAEEMEKLTMLMNRLRVLENRHRYDGTPVPQYPGHEPTEPRGTPQPPALRERVMDPLPPSVSKPAPPATEGRSD
jgi:hypothetical protein